jgi:peptidoglycan/LPS O-acetylase OafA/YrhL
LFVSSPLLLAATTLDPYSRLAALAVLLLALLVSAALVRQLGAPATSGRHVTIDGLRGYLALAVFLHHAAIWYGYLRSGVWDAPPSHLYTHFGQSSVALFFMITGFLFIGRLLDARARGTSIDWGRLMLGRVLRLVPLYLVAMAVLLGLVLALSGGTLQVPIGRLVSGLLRWLNFFSAGKPDLNGVEHTWILIAGVVWSLQYEWLFYLALPVIALGFGQRPSWGWRLVGTLALVKLLLITFDSGLRWRSEAFLGGAAAAWLVRQPRWCDMACRPLASGLAVALLGGAIAGFPTAYQALPLLLLSVAFALMAGGADLFGLLRWPVSRLLGELSYSLYLLHGLLLFVTWRFVIGFDAARALTPVQHWAVIAALAPVLVLVSAWTHRHVELPPLRHLDALMTRLRRTAPVSSPAPR